MDISEQITPVGTYHSIRGRRIQIVYPGNPKTCGNCHKTSNGCPGKGIAKKWRNNGGLAIHLNDPMKTLHAQLGKLRNKMTSTQVVETDEIVTDIPATSVSPNDDLINLSHVEQQEEFSNHQKTSGDNEIIDPNFSSL